MPQNWLKISEPPALAADDLHVWSVTLDVVPGASAELLNLLAADERERAARFRVDDARRRFVVARANLRRILGKYLRVPPEEIAFEYDDNGKPRLQRSSSSIDLQFNLAHSGELALVAATRGCEVGVDVERLRDVNHWQEIAVRYFHPREMDEISILPAAEQLRAFMRCWTGKEAVLKALGFGITRPLDFFVGDAQAAEGAWIELQVAGQPTRCHLIPLQPGDDYLGAVACLRAKRNLQRFGVA